jgi:putative acetyltransferase
VVGELTVAAPDELVRVRLECPADIAAIHELTRRAFLGKPYSQGDEQDLNDALRNAGALVLSLVAEREGVIVGHVAFSPGVTEDAAGGWYALGPIAVDPDLQRQGIGGRLIAKGMELLMGLGAQGCVLIGDTGYYPRHGFVPRPDLAPVGEPAQHYMVRKLDPTAPDAIVSFHTVFHDLDAKP